MIGFSKAKRRPSVTFESGPRAPLHRWRRSSPRWLAPRPGEFEDALTNYRELMRGLTKEDQQEFAANFAESLAESATRAGEFKAAREVYEILLTRFSNPELRNKVRDDLARLDMVGKPAPSLIVKSLNGETLRLSDLKGKYVLIDFWATWCAPCVAETPNLQKLYKAYHDKGFEIIGVSLDETLEPLNDFLKTRQDHLAASP